MKICYLGDVSSPHVQRWVKFFAEKGDEVHVISINPPDESYKIIKDFKKINVYILRKYRSKFTGRITNFLYQANQVRKLTKIINPDIIHSHFARSYGLFGFLTFFHPFLLSVHGSDVLLSPKKSQLVRITLPFTIRSADRVLATAEPMRKYLQKNFRVAPSKIVRLQWGIDVNIFTRGYVSRVETLRKVLDINKESIVILSARGMTSIYNNHFLIRAIPQIIQKNPKVVFILLRGLGEDSQYENQLEKEVKELDIQKNIRFILKKINPREMATYLNLSKIFVSIPNTDQFGSSVLEGMACGAIPVVSNIEVYKQYLINNENAYFVESNDPKDIAEKINRILANMIEIREFCFRINRKIVLENENASILNEKMLQLYRAVLSRN